MLALGLTKFWDHSVERPKVSAEIANRADFAVTAYSEEMMISTWYVSGFMSNSHKKSWTVSNLHFCIEVGLGI